MTHQQKHGNLITNLETLIDVQFGVHPRCPLPVDCDVQSIEWELIQRAVQVLKTVTQRNLK
jgi:hypothetical protein